jgi:CheY-like chemotaxis protein
LCFYNGEEAVSLVERNPDVNLVLMDINLGDGMDGTERRGYLEKRNYPPFFSVVARRSGRSWRRRGHHILR